MSKSLYKIAIIGPTDVVSGFRALGVDTFPAHDSDSVLEQLKNIKQLPTEGGPAYAVVCIIEDLMIGMDEKEYARVMSGHFKRKKEPTQADKEALIDQVAAGKEINDPGQTVGSLPAVVILPGTSGSQGFAEARLRKLSEKAIGASII